MIIGFPGSMYIEDWVLNAQSLATVTSINYKEVWKLRQGENLLW